MPKLRLTAARTTHHDGTVAFVDVELVDANGTVHVLPDKTPMFGIEEEPFITYPMEFDFEVRVDEDDGSDTVWVVLGIPQNDGSELRLGTIRHDPTLWNGRGGWVSDIDRFEVRRSDVIW